MGIKWLRNDHLCYKIIIECGEKKNVLAQKKDYFDYFRKKLSVSTDSWFTDSDIIQCAISVCCPQGAVWVKNLTAHQRLVCLD